MKVLRAIALILVAVMLVGCGATGCGGQEQTPTQMATKPTVTGATNVVPTASSNAVTTTTSLSGAVPVIPTQAAPAVSSASPTSSQPAGFSIPNPLEEVRKLWGKVELPVKETMFLGGRIIGPLEPLLACLNPLGYMFAMFYCLVAVHWQLNHSGTSWQEFMDDFLLGSPGKMAVIVSIMAAPVVYLTALHDFSLAFWWTDNTFLREALGWKLAGFSPDLDPESMLELLKWLPEWASLHITHEVFLLISFFFAILLAGLKRNLAPLRIWSVFYLMYALYGVAVYVAVIFVDSVRGTDLVGNNPIWSSFVRINKMFVGSTKGLWYLMAYAIPIAYAIYELFFASGRGNRGRRHNISSQSLLDAAQTLAILSSPIIAQNVATQGGNAWGMNPHYPANHPRLGQGMRGLPDGMDNDIPPDGKGPGKDSPPSDGSGGDQRTTTSRPTGPNGIPKPTDHTLPPVGGNNPQVGQKPSDGLWTILPPTARERGGQPSRNSNSATQVTPIRISADGVVPLPGGVTRNAEHTIPKVIGGSDDAIPVDVTKEELGTSAQAEFHGKIKPHSNQAEPAEDNTIPEPFVTEHSLPADDLQSVAEHVGKTDSEEESVFKKARMKTKFGDLDVDEPVMVSVKGGTATTVDGKPIPFDQLTFEPEVKPDGGNA